ncbi:MAG: HEAT repeat domain-containing protein [Anaerolineae bacterium]|nr:HEAT repeat domain-containing protein [Anaerolineae bacterium]
MGGTGTGREPSLGGRTHPLDGEPGLGGERARSAALEGIESKDWNIRIRAIRELGRYQDDTVSERLVDMLNDWNKRVRQEAALKLIEIGEPAVPALIAMLPKGDGITCGVIVDTLTKICTPESLVLRMGASSVPALIDMLPKADTITHMLTALVLTQICTLDDLIILLGAPASQDVSVGFAVRHAAFKAIRRLEYAAEPALLGVLDSKNPNVRRDAADLLSYLSLMKKPDTRSEFIQLLADPEPEIRAIVAYSLVKSWVLLPKKMAPALIACLQDQDEYVRHHAALALGHIVDARSIPHLFDMAKNDADIIVRTAAVRSLGSSEIIDSVPASESVSYTKTLLEALDTILRELTDISGESGLYDYEKTRDTVVLCGATDISGLIRYVSDMAAVWHACYDEQMRMAGTTAMRLRDVLAHVLRQTDTEVWIMRHWYSRH